MIKVNYYILISVFVFLSSFLFGQKEGNIWYFGGETDFQFYTPLSPCAGINFNGSTPTAITTGTMSTNEGCATISDKTTGQLLMYTDGVTIYNNAHQPMPNGTGLLGSSTSTQSGVIIPWPENDSLYFVFSVGAQAGYDPNPGKTPGKGVSYSIVNMKLDGGKGDVIAGSKNVVIDSITTEKLAAIRHGNGKDIWVITHPWNSNRFNAFLITSTGIAATPVSSDVGTVHFSSTTQGASASLGYLKPSPNGQMLALAIWEPVNIVEVDHFNNTTGNITSWITIPMSAHKGPYGLSFSPNNSKLYVTTRSLPGNPLFGFDISSTLLQYDLCPENEADIIASRVTLDSNYFPSAKPYLLGALQVGPDKKIYVATPTKTAISRINFPDLSGTACNYAIDALSLNGRKCENGLPVFIENYFEVPFPADFSSAIACANDTTVFSDLSATADSWLWDFGDPASSSNTDTLKNPSHIYTASGSYTVSLTIFKDCQTASVSKTIDVSCTEPPLLPSGVFIPNVFTPDGDGTNDRFKLTITALGINEMKIYNRWGQVVYESTNASNSWDGVTSSGVESPSGTYYYVLKLSDTTTHNGIVTLVRGK